MTVIDRPFDVEKDYLALRELVMESYRRDPKHYNWPLCRLDSLRYGALWREELSGDRIWPEYTHVWEDAGSGRLLGVCHFEWAHQGAVEVAPDARALEDAMFAWLEARYAQTRTADTPLYETWVFEGDAYRKKVLAQRGWQPGPFCGVTRIRDMTLPIEEAPVAPGFTVRRVADDDPDEWARLAASTNAVFPHATFEPAAYDSLRRAPTWNTHYVAVAPDGRFASFAGIWYVPAIRQGQFEPVGTLAEFRRLGLARAVMTAGLRHLRDLGAAKTYVDTGYDSEANALYAGLGFTEVDAFECWKLSR